LLKHEWSPILHHWGSDCTVHHDIDRRLAINAAFLREKHAFGECQHLYRKLKIQSNLHRQSQPVVPHMCHLRADVLKDGLYACEGLGAAANHYRQLSLLKSDDAS